MDDTNDHLPGIDAPLDDAPLSMDSCQSYSHLSYPPSEPQCAPGVQRSEPHSRTLLPDRLYIGNLHPTVDEFTLLQIFSKFGKVTKLDYLFHKAGLLKGKPRGYAFLEYSSEDDAKRALTTAHDRPLRGRRLVVTFAHQAPPEHVGAYGMRQRRILMETGRPTTLSMLKTASGRYQKGTHSKIAMMEAKLRQMASTSPHPVASSSASTADTRQASNPDAIASTSPPLSNYFSHSQMASQIIPPHPSLPAKPPPSVPTHPDQRPRAPPQRPLRDPLPSLPIKYTQRPIIGARCGSGAGGSGGAMHPARGTKSKLVGVKIKSKEKERPETEKGKGG